MQEWPPWKDHALPLRKGHAYHQKKVNHAITWTGVMLGRTWCMHVITVESSHHRRIMRSVAIASCNIYIRSLNHKWQIATQHLPVRQDETNHTCYEVQVIRKTAHWPSKQASFPKDSGMVMQENQPVARIAARHNICRHMSWIFLLLVVIDPACEATTPRMRDSGELYAYRHAMSRACHPKEIMRATAWDLEDHVCLLTIILSRVLS